MRRLITFALALWSFVTVAQVIPSDRQISWATWTGVSGGIPSVTTVYTNMTGLDNTGATDCSAAIQAALNACPSNQVVKIPAGTFLITNGVIVNVSGTVLRGAGKTATIFSLQHPAARADGGIRVGTTADLAPSLMWTNAGTAIKGATNLTLLTTNGLAVGNIVLIEQINDTNVVFNWSQDGSSGSQDYHANTSLTNYLQVQMIKVLSISGTNITFEPPLINTWTNTQNCRLFRRGNNNWPRRMGVEDCTIYMPTNNYTTSWQRDLQFAFGDECWGKNVRVYSWDRYGAYINSAYRTTLESCDFEGLNFGGSGGNYAIGIVFASGFSRVENNTCHGAISMVVLAEMAHANAILYNFEATNHYESSPGVLTTLQAGLSSHDCYTHFNLLEGNVAPMFIADMSHGNGGYNILLRNRLYGWQPSTVTKQLRSVVLDYGHWNYSVAGNVLGGPWVPYYSLKNGPNGDQMATTTNALQMFGYATGPLPQAWTNNIYHSNVLYTAVLRGNYIAGATDTTNGIPSDQSYTNLESSLVYSSRPSYFGGLAWPPVNPESPTTNYHARLIPAMYRFFGETVPSALPDVTTTTLNVGTLVFP